ncbi:uncharacterized protein LOC107266125 isoform X2 [Cephus cinctus]|uniref:Uncharacterized protein LOC107266125 isoform X2 n=1 Tax=Cephus cinctus TaxID=211228 RepID=A0AAJ7W055_CEPCN|nr:uncharacterized protein LOC107266125 isoform X2 [Cephus cinctus]
MGGVSQVIVYHSIIGCILKGSSEWYTLRSISSKTSALHCWSCSSDATPDCADPLNATEHNKLFHTKACEGTMSPHHYLNEKPVCRKTVQYVSGERRVIRACSVPNPDERDIVDGPCTHLTTASYITIESCHICNTDYCNTATYVSGSWLISVAAMAAAAVGGFSTMSIAI